MTEHDSGALDNNILPILVLLTRSCHNCDVHSADYIKKKHLVVVLCHVFHGVLFVLTIKVIFPNVECSVYLYVVRGT